MVKEPKDLGIKIGTPTEVLWTKVLKESNMLIKQSEENLQIQKELNRLAKEKIAQEQKV